jgi:hypothetical protein
LFNAITKAGAEAANYPFCTIEPNVGVVTVPDERIRVLTELNKSRKTIYTTIEFCDIAGLVAGASKGEGLGNKFLGHIRQVAAIVHVVRCFENDNIVHVSGQIDPLSDIETIITELILSDMEVLERRITKSAKGARNDKALAAELAMLKKVNEFLGTGKSARAMELDEEEAAFVETLGLLSFKPIIYVANVSEDDAAEAAGPGELPRHAPEHQLIALLVGESLAAVAGGVDPRRAVQGVHAQTGVVRDGGEAAGLHDGLGLDAGVVREGLAVLLRLQVQTQLRLEHHLHAQSAQNLLHFPQLVLIVAGKNKFHECQLLFCQGDCMRMYW